MCHLAANKPLATEQRELSAVQRRALGRSACGCAHAALVVAIFVLCAACPSKSMAATKGSPQTPSAAPASASRAVGTVKSISGSIFTLVPDNGQPLSVQVGDTSRILRLAAGSTDMKTAQPVTVKDIEVGDRLLVRGTPGDTAGTITASLVVVMKQGDIQQKQEQERLDWQKRGTGGLVSAVDPATSTVTISTVSLKGPVKLQIHVTPKTVLRRYAADSVKFEDARPGTFTDIKPGDQLRARGDKNADGTTLEAEEVVSGSFLNIAGTISKIDLAASSITLKDLVTKKVIVVKVTPNSDLHALPLQMANMLAARVHGASGKPGGEAGSGAPDAHMADAANRPGRRMDGTGAMPTANEGGPQRGGGLGLSQMIAHSPATTIAQLKPNDAVMIVATPGAAGTPDTVTAITLLSGVEPILAATPKNSSPMSLSPWTLGGDAPTE